MPGKRVQCPTCSRMMQSDNLKRHENICLSKHRTAEFFGIRPAKIVKSDDEVETTSTNSDANSVSA